MSTSTCTINPDVLASIKAIRFAQQKGENVKAYVAKIDPAQKQVVEDEAFDDISLEDLVEELPDDSPRYMVLSYRHVNSESRVSFPLVFVYYCPETAKPTNCMLYANTHDFFEREVGLSKAYMLREKEDLNQEWLDQNVSKFGS